MGLENFDRDQHMLHSRLMRRRDMRDQPQIAMAIVEADRRKFVPPELKNKAFEATRIIPIGEVSSLSMIETVADLLVLAHIEEGHKVLDAGGGIGFQTAVISELVGITGQVISAEWQETLIPEAQNNLQDYPNVQILGGDAGNIMKETAPFDRIVFSMAVASPKLDLISQYLNDDGLLVAPVSNVYWQPHKCRMASYQKYKDRAREVDSLGSGYDFMPALGILGWKK